MRLDPPKAGIAISQISKTADQHPLQGCLAVFPAAPLLIVSGGLHPLFVLNPLVENRDQRFGDQTGALFADSVTQLGDMVGA